MSDRQVRAEAGDGQCDLDGEPLARRAGSHDTRRKGRQHDQRLDHGPMAYDVEEVTRRLGITRPTLYQFLRSGELRSFRLGSRRLVSADALADFIRFRESLEAG